MPDSTILLVLQVACGSMGAGLLVQGAITIGIMLIFAALLIPEKFK